MKLSLKPELKRFVEDQVRNGRFASAQEAVEAGIARLMLDAPDELDNQDVSDITRSLEEMNKGDVVDWRQFSAEVRKKYFGK